MSTTDAQAAYNRAAAAYHGTIGQSPAVRAAAFRVMSLAAIRVAEGIRLIQNENALADRFAAANARRRAWQDTV